MRRLRFTLYGLLCFGVLSAAAVSADIYKYSDAFGNITLTDRPMKGNVKLLKVYRGLGQTRSGGSFDAELYRKNRKRYSPLIDKVAERESLQPELLHAVVTVESAYNPQAVSAKGAVGLMQLMPDTAKRYGVENIHDPVENVQAGASYLKDLLEEFDQDLKLALAAYNAGENAVRRYGNQIPPFPETQTYVRKVIGLYGQSYQAR